MKELRELFKRVDENKEAMKETWRKLVDRDCGSGNKAGVDAVGKEIEAFLKDIGFSVRFYTYEYAGNMLVAELGDMTKPFVILTGHMDTVFADGTASARPFTIKEGKVTGPGVLDMKGGITILLYAVKFLKEAGYDKHPLKIILAGDEEVAHGKSSAASDIMKEADGAIMAFNMETGFLDDSIVIQRKGVAQVLFEVTGVGAHAGNNPKDGRSAVEELSHKILDILKETDYEEGTTVNVGVIGGGTVANAVPEHAWCKVDVRYSQQKGIDRIEKAFKEIALRQYVDHTTTVLSPIVKFAAMEQVAGTSELFEKAQAVAKTHGFPEMKALSVGGGSDSAFITAAGVPTLCALGVKGQFNHTEREWALEDSLYERCKLLMTLLCEL